MSRCAYVVNSTPKYYPLLKAHFSLLDRYGRGFSWPRYLGTEAPDHPQLRDLSDVNLVKLDRAVSGFWESRVATVEALPASVQYILPMQEDFLLERPGVDVAEIEKVVGWMDENPKIQSARLMPCPGPVVQEPCLGNWATLTGADPYLFTFQATIWRRDAYCMYLKLVIQAAKMRHPFLPQDGKDWARVAIDENTAENEEGKMIFQTLFPDALHLAWIRWSSRANAVYECPWPYRPTAIVKGVLQTWAKELVAREGLELRWGA